MPSYILPDELMARQPTLLEIAEENTGRRLRIDNALRETDAKNRVQRAWDTLEGVESDAPQSGYSMLFGAPQRAQSEFRSREDAAAFLRARDPDRFTKTMEAVGGFMANSAIPALRATSDPRARVEQLSRLAQTGPPMLRALVADISSDGVITDDELAQAEQMFAGYAAVPEGSEWRAGGGGSGVVFRTGRGGELETALLPGGEATREYTGEAANLQAAYAALERNPNDPVARAVIAKHEASLRPQSGGGSGRPNRSWQTINGRRMLVDDNTGAVIHDAGEAGTGGQSTEILPDGTVRISTGKIPSTIQSDAYRTQQALMVARSDLDEYTQLLSQGVPSYSAGAVGSAVNMVTAVGSQIGVTAAVNRALNAVGARPTALSDDKRRRVRVLADRLRSTVGPLLTSALKGNPSNKDMQLAEAQFGLLNNAGSVEEAQLRITLIRRGLEAARQWSEQVLRNGSVRLADPIPETVTPRATPVVPQGNASERLRKWRESLGRPTNAR